MRCLPCLNQEHEGDSLLLIYSVGRNSTNAIVDCGNESNIALITPKYRRLQKPFLIPGPGRHATSLLLLKSCHGLATLLEFGEWVRTIKKYLQALLMLINIQIHGSQQYLIIVIKDL